METGRGSSTGMPLPSPSTRSENSTERLEKTTAKTSGRPRRPMRGAMRLSASLRSPYAKFGILSLILFLSMFANTVLAEQSVKTIEIPFGYVAQTVANNWYTKDIKLESPDGIEKIISAEILLRGDFLSGTKIYVEIDGKTCKETYWAIPNQNVANYLLSFDCSNLAGGKTGGTYTVRMKSDKIAQNIYVNIRFTYYNNPPSSVASIGGTEYKAGEPARVVLSILDNQGKPINDGSCFTTIRNSEDAAIVNNESLNYISDSNGIYFYQFVSEMPIGVYSVDSYCVLDGENVYASDTFHISQWAEDIRNIKEGMGLITTSPEPYIGFVGGTEYTQNEYAGLRTQFLNGNGEPIFPTGQIRAYRVFGVDTSEVLWYSENEGVNWNVMTNGYSGVSSNTLKMVSCNDGVQFAVNTQDDIYKSIDGGVSWAVIKSNYNGAETTSATAMECSKFNNELMIIESDEDVWISSDGGITWSKTAINFNGAAGNAYGVSTNTTGYWFAVDTIGAVWSSPNGTTWTKIATDYNGGASNSEVDYEVTDNNTHWILEGSTRDVWKSNDGYIWTIATSDFGGTTSGVDMTYDGKNLYIVNGVQDIWRSSENDGTVWTLTASNFNLDDGAVVSIFPSINTNFFGARAGACKFSLFAPNYTKIFNDTNMSYINNSNGIFAYDWSDTNKALGIYTVDVVCTMGSKSYYGSSTFHVGNMTGIGGNVSCYFNTTDIENKIISVNDTVKNESVQIQLNQQEIYNWLQDFNQTEYNRVANTWNNQQTILNAIHNITFNDTEILDAIHNTNTTIMTKLHSIQDDLTNLESSLTSLINSAKADILSQMNVYYSNLYTAIMNIPSSVITQISGEAPDWFSCVAQKITGVYPAGSKCT